MSETTDERITVATITTNVERLQCRLDDDEIIEATLRCHCPCGSWSQKIVAPWQPVGGGSDVGVRIKCNSCGGERLAIKAAGYEGSAMRAERLNDNWAARRKRFAKRDAWYTHAR